MVLYSIATTGILAILAGLIVLVWPRSLSIVVGLWLIITGVLSFVNY